MDDSSPSKNGNAENSGSLSSPSIRESADRLVMMLSADYFYLDNNYSQSFNCAIDAVERFLINFLQEQAQPNSQERLPMPPNICKYAPFE